MTAKPKVLENVKRSLKTSKEYEACVLSSTVGSASRCPSIIQPLAVEAVPVRLNPGLQVS